MDKYTDPVPNLGSKISVDDAIFQIEILTEIVTKSIFKFWLFEFQSAWFWTKISIDACYNFNIFSIELSEIISEIYSYLDDFCKHTELSYYNSGYFVSGVSLRCEFWPSMALNPLDDQCLYCIWTPWQSFKR